MVHKYMYKRPFPYLNEAHTLIETACAGIILIHEQSGRFAALACTFNHGFKQL